MAHAHRSEPITRKINRSSLGSPAARKLRARTPPAVANRIVSRSTKVSSRKMN